MGPFSLFNLLPILTAPSSLPPATFQDPKVLAYNFTMDKPSLVRDNFTVLVFLDKNPALYNIRAYTYDWFHVQTSSASGEYQYNYSINVNGARIQAGSVGVAWIDESTKMGGAGPTPDLCCQGQNMTNLHTGVNVFEFRFVQFSRLSQYGTGYYNLKLGPFSVYVSSIPVSIVGPLSLEIIVAVLLIPVSFLLSLASYRIKRTGRPPPPQ